MRMLTSRTNPLSAAPYNTGGLCANPLIPAEEDSVKITVRAREEGEFAGPVEADLIVRSDNGRTSLSRIETAADDIVWSNNDDTTFDAAGHHTPGTCPPPCR